MYAFYGFLCLVTHITITYSCNEIHIEPHTQTHTHTQHSLHTHIHTLLPFKLIIVKINELNLKYLKPLYLSYDSKNKQINRKNKVL